ncbi:hypothetical protein NUSPORA_01277 [Nucleospora cyclopteri]
MVTPISIEHTLILVFSESTIKVGYVGEFTYRQSLSVEGIWVQGHIANVEKLISKATQLGIEYACTTAIFVMPPATDLLIKQQILQHNVYFQGILFLDNLIASAMGQGKTTSTVLHLENTTAAIGFVQSGELVENYTFNYPESPIDGIHPNQATQLSYSHINCMREEYLGTDLTAQLTNLPGKNTTIKINPNYNKLKEILNKIVEIRAKRNLKKGSSLIVSGNLTRIKGIKKYIQDHLINNNMMEEAILFNITDLETQFVGTSLIGNNNFSKYLFITKEDWEIYKQDIFEIKAINK